MKIILIILVYFVCAGCGSDFEWFPKYGSFSNRSTAGNGTSPVTSPVGTVKQIIPFPAGVTWITDLVYDKNSSSFWLLTGTPSAPSAIVKMSINTGILVDQIDIADPGNLVDGCSMAYDGSSFWITSNVYDNSVTPRVPKSEIYQFSSFGFLLKTYPCPPTTTGFCQGLAWDSTTSSFWAAGSDNRILENFQFANGAVTSHQPYANLWDTNGVSDAGFDSIAKKLLVIKGGVVQVDAFNGTAGNKVSFTPPGTGRGDWDGTYFWFIDNSAKKIKAVIVK